jgi:hypothetical protein
MDSLSRWSSQHPLSLAFITLFVGGLISVYSGDIRSFISIPPQRLNIWFLKTRISSAEYRLKYLTELHNDTNRLVAVMALAMFGALVALSMVLVGIYLRPSTSIWDIVNTPNMSLIALARATIYFMAPFSGALLIVIIVSTSVPICRQLIHFEEWAAFYEEKLFRLRAQLEAKELSPVSRTKKATGGKTDD